MCCWVTLIEADIPAEVPLPATEDPIELAGMEQVPELTLLSFPPELTDWCCEWGTFPAVVIAYPGGW